jgi:hypothetical protein
MTFISIPCSNPDPKHNPNPEPNFNPNPEPNLNTVGSVVLYRVPDSCALKRKKCYANFYFLARLSFHFWKVNDRSSNPNPSPKPNPGTIESFLRLLYAFFLNHSRSPYHNSNSSLNLVIRRCDSQSA